jgi:F-type H+-transporting ATPase subunit b
MDTRAKETLGAALRNSKDPSVIQSAFDMPAAQMATIRNALNETFSAEIRVRFEAAPDRICGIELMADGQKLGWSIADYLTSLDRKVGALLNEPAPAEAGPAVQ